MCAAGVLCIEELDTAVAPLAVAHDAVTALRKIWTMETLSSGLCVAGGLFIEDLDIIGGCCFAPNSSLESFMCAAGVLCVEELDFVVAPLARRWSRSMWCDRFAKNIQAG